MLLKRGCTKQLKDNLINKVVSRTVSTKELSQLTESKPCCNRVNLVQKAL